MPDAAFAHPRLAALYDAFDDDRSDLDVYAAIVREVGAHSVLDIGCGTGTLAVALAQAGLVVIGLDPAAASLEVARAKPGAESVRWLLGDASALPSLAVDLVTMTGNVAQAIVAPADWSETLARSREALRPGGMLVFETRVPAARAWEAWTPELTRRRIGDVVRWTEVTEADLPLVSFRTTFVFDDGETLTSDSTLRFRDRPEVERDLAAHGLEVVEVRDAPDRPGKELVFFARRA